MKWIIILKCEFFWTVLNPDGGASAQGPAHDGIVDTVELLRLLDFVNIQSRLLIYNFIFIFRSNKLSFFKHFHSIFWCDLILNNDK